MWGLDSRNSWAAAETVWARTIFGVEPVHKRLLDCHDLEARYHKKYLALFSNVNDGKGSFRGLDQIEGYWHWGEIEGKVTLTGEMRSRGTNAARSFLIPYLLDTLVHDALKRLGIGHTFAQAVIRLTACGTTHARIQPQRPITASIVLTTSMREHN